MSVRTTEPQDEPFAGRTIMYRTGKGEEEWRPAVVVSVREDRSTVALIVHGETDTRELVPHADVGIGIGDPPVSTWLTLDEYEGWQIWRAEREAKLELEGRDDDA